MSKIGKNIRKIRITKGLSQAAFAEIFSITRASIGAYEEERAEPKTDIMLQIANYFSIPIDKLLTEELTVNALAKFNVDEILNTAERLSIPIINPESYHLIKDGDFSGLQTLNFPSNIFKGDVAIIIKDQSEIKFKNNTLLICSKCDNPITNKEYLIERDGSLMMQIYKKGKGKSIEIFFEVNHQVTPIYKDHENKIEERLKRLEDKLEQLMNKL